jgi:hypothetical protein
MHFRQYVPTVASAADAGGSLAGSGPRTRERPQLQKQWLGLRCLRGVAEFYVKETPRQPFRPVIADHSV